MVYAIRRSNTPRPGTIVQFYVDVCLNGCLEIKHISVARKASLRRTS